MAWRACQRDVVRAAFEHQRRPLAKELAETVAARIRTAIAERGTAAIAVSGGSTPARFFQAAAVAGVPDGANADGRIKVANVMATEDQAIQQAVVDAAGHGDLDIPIAKTFALADGARAHALLAAGRVGGKIILVP